MADLRELALKINKECASLMMGPVEIDRMVEILSAALAEAPKAEQWTLVEGYEGVLKHCGSRDAVKLEPKEHTGVFCIVGNKFYAYRLPSYVEESK